MIVGGRGDAGLTPIAGESPLPSLIKHLRLHRAVARGKIERPGREGEVGAERGQLADQRQVDPLLDVHVEVVVGTQHVVDDLEVQRRVAEGGEVGAVEAGRVDPLDDPPDHAGDLFQHPAGVA